MKVKHPPRKEELTPLSEARRRGIDREVFMKELGKLDHDVAEGLGGLRNEHLTCLLFNPQREVTPGAAAAADNLYAFADNVVQCRLPPYFYKGYVATRLPANKVDPSTLALGATPDARPINVGNALRRLITRAYFDDGLLATINEFVAPVQNGAGLKGGISLSVLGVQATLEARPDFCVIHGDLKNGYNEVKRESVMASVREIPELHDTMDYFFQLLAPRSYVGIGSGTNVSTAPFRIEEGVQQGAVESLYMFALAVNKPYQRALADLKACWQSPPLHSECLDRSRQTSCRPAALSHSLGNQRPTLPRSSEMATSRRFAPRLASPIASSLTRTANLSSPMGSRCEALQSATSRLGQRGSLRPISPGSRLVLSVTTI